MRSPCSLCLCGATCNDLLPVILLSLYVSGAALAVATVIGVPAGAGLALRPVPGQRLIELLIYTGMGLPPVVVGLFVYLLLSRSGPFGFLSWLFTPAAMITAQVIIALPLVIGLTMSAVASVDPALRLQVRSLGATSAQVMWTVLWEAEAGGAAGERGAHPWGAPGAATRVAPTRDDRPLPPHQRQATLRRSHGVGH